MSFRVLRMTHPSAIVTLIVPTFPWRSNSIVTFELGAMQMLPRAPNLIVAPTPSGVSIDAGLGMVAPVTALAPFTRIGLLSRVVRTPNNWGTVAETLDSLDSAKPAATPNCATAKVSKRAATVIPL